MFHAMITGGVAIARSPATKFKKQRRPTLVPIDSDIIIITIIVIIAPPPSYSSSEFSLNDLAPRTPHPLRQRRKSKMASNDTRPSLRSFNRLPACLPANRAVPHHEIGLPFPTCIQAVSYIAANKRSLIHQILLLLLPNLERCYNFHPAPPLLRL